MTSNTNRTPKHGALSGSLGTDLADTVANQLVDEKSQVNADKVIQKKGSVNPNWDWWKKREGVRLWEAVALSKNIKPSRLEKIKAQQPNNYRYYFNRLNMAISWLNISLPIMQDHPNNGILPENRVVLLSDFVQCAQSKGTKLPTGLQEIFAKHQNMDKPVSEAKEIKFSLPTNSGNNDSGGRSSDSASPKTEPAQVQTPAAAHTPWEIKDPKDPEPEQPWYTPARYFARELVRDDPTLLTKKIALAEKVATSLINVGVCKRGGKKKLLASTILKSFVNVTLN